MSLRASTTERGRGSASPSSSTRRPWRIRCTPSSARSKSPRIRQIFPDREIIELPNNDPIIISGFSVGEKYQVGNFRSMLRNGNTYRADGSTPHWRAMRDDKGRVMVAINFNNDFGDSWQLADDPRYPEKFSYLGIRLGINYVIYAMTH